MPSNKRTWQDLSELTGSGEAIKGRDSEFSEPLPIDRILSDKKFSGAGTNRRDFLKFLGFGLGAATLAACETPVIKSIPYVVKPEEITPGVANWYASTYYDGQDYASILVKTREGRPIHIKGNPRFGINRRPDGSKGSINARINSSVLPLYDNERLKGPMMNHGEGLMQHSWSDADKAIGAKLADISHKGGRIVVLTHTIISPSTREAINVLRAKYGMALNTGDDALSVQVGGTVDHVQYDTISYNGLVNANAKSFGKRVMPGYDLAKADVLVGVDADFLATWGTTTVASWQYATRRKPDGGAMNKHFQFESRLTLTGANADERTAVKPSELGTIVASLHDQVAAKLGGAKCGAGDAACDAATAKAAEALIAAKGRSLVLCGVNDEGVQVLVNSINWMLGNYGSTIDLDNHTYFHQGDDAAVAQLVKDMNAGKVGALLIAGVNPAYSLPNAAEFREGLKKVELSVSFSGYADETASLCAWIAPDNHYLESWNDHLPKPGHYALAQPAINKLYDTRQWQESLLAWSGVTKDYYTFIRDVWQAGMTGHTATPVDFTAAWNMSVHNGVYEAYSNQPGQWAFAGDVATAGAAARKLAEGAGEWQLQVYVKNSIGSGLHANNPWLQEMPDALTKITWDNYITMSPIDMENMGLQTYIGQQSPASVCAVKVGEVEVKLPCVPVPGQKQGTLGIALGYGRGANGEKVGRAAVVTDPDADAPAPVGRNAYPFVQWNNGIAGYTVNNASIAATGETYALAITQTHLTDMQRDSVVKETSLAVFASGDKHAYNHSHTIPMHYATGEKDEPVTAIDLWEEHPVAEVGHRWGMSIDLNSCNGCGACITACNSENNIPVVGKDEVRRSREMHWMRVDRYYSTDMTKALAKEQGIGKIDMYLAMEEPSAAPRVTFVPLMCQHCNHAPCETVCPVAATTHSNEGLNQMAYNRCIGTRYCANNCPYKVRRFNWFNYVTEKFGEVNPAWDEVGRLVLNPDVVVRSRGVIEKCSLCVQQIQAGKLAAKKAGTPVKDGSIQTACSAGCPTDAITFGDLNDEKSAVKAQRESDRAYIMIEEVGTQPNINYMVKVRNADMPMAHHEGGHEEHGAEAAEKPHA